jgi:hypothetical protein
MRARKFITGFRRASADDASCREDGFGIFVSLPTDVMPDR